MGTEDSKADSLGLWAPVLWVVIQRPKCMPATGRERGIQQKAKVTPLRVHWWKVVTGWPLRRSPLRSSTAPSRGNSAISATEDHLGTPCPAGRPAAWSVSNSPGHPGWKASRYLGDTFEASEPSSHPGFWTYQHTPYLGSYGWNPWKGLSWHMGKKRSLASSPGIPPTFQKDIWQSGGKMLNTEFPKDTKTNCSWEILILLETIC